MESAFIGNVIDHYRIIERLGIGGMGVVFKAINININKLVALKMITPGLAMNENFIKRFQIEAKALAKLNDFNIVSITDLRRDKDQWFIVMEYVDGDNLFDIIKKDGAYDCKESIPILKQILTAIGHAHKAGIIHRDIKPNNIMVTKDGVVKITDFGLAKDQNLDASAVSIASGGTLYYMSPEHVKGFSFTDHRSDIYSIGMTYYEMITGKVPFQNINSDFDMRERIIRKNFEKPSVFNPKIPPGLEAIVMKSIAKDPDMRYQSAKEMLAAVEKFEKYYSSAGHRPADLATEKPTGSFKISEPGEDSRKKHSILKKVIPVTALALFFFLIYFFYPAILNRFLPQKTIEVLTELTDTSPQPQTALPIPKDTLAGQPQKAQRKIETKPAQTVTQAKLSLSTIAIRSTPSGAEVRLNGKRRGSTPLKLKKLKSGNYQLNIRKQGFAEYSKQIRLSEKGRKIINASLVPFTGGLIISSEQQDVQIFIDGQRKSVSALKNLTVGRHKLEIKKSGFSNHSEEIEIQHNKNTTISAKLVRLQGNLSIQVNPWGSIYINGQLHKADTDIKYNVALPAKTCKLKIVHPTLGVWEKTVEIQSAETSAFIVDFNKTRAVRVFAEDENGEPLSAAIYVDNKNTDHITPGAITARIGYREIFVEKEGYTAVTKKERLMVDNRFNDELKFILKKVK